MPFEKFESPIEKKIERAEEEERNREKLISFIKEIAENLREKGLPLTEDCRIDMRAFEEIYPEETIKKDQELVRKYEWKEYKGLSEEEIRKEKTKRDGEKLEMLKTAIFAKNLGEDFIVARTSLYDDFKNKIDNLILEKETGNVVCAFDEVGESMDERYQEKVEKVMTRNTKEGGAGLEYGFKVEKDKEGQSKLVLGREKNIPLFYLVLPKRHIEGGIKELIPSFGEKSDYEKKLFNYFLNALFHQINYLKLGPDLNPTLRRRIDNFEKTLQKFK